MYRLLNDDGLYKSESPKMLMAYRDDPLSTSRQATDRDGQAIRLSVQDKNFGGSPKLVLTAMLIDCAWNLHRHVPRCLFNPARQGTVCLRPWNLVIQKIYSESGPCWEKGKGLTIGGKDPTQSIAL
ncbi:hypothetical protein AVEN_164006-1 [Araneus ventricosus]|uniref:Uncharacterized protein n=1 Tax=Araneus ventricosus TaxID=182803 RepID=A0A4Y2D830_ARAVE|nr:hypothetical protein AVEN_164006-1 [Araneus ventricosus]